MPILQVVEPVEGSQFHGKYFAGVIGENAGRAGPKLVSNITDAQVMNDTESQQVIEDWSAWFTLRAVDLRPQDIEQKQYKHGVGFMATCPNCSHRKRMLNIRDRWWFICPCGYQAEMGDTQTVQSA